MKEKILVDRGYTIDKDGNVYNPSGCKLEGKDKNGYRAIAIKIDGKRVDVKTHRFQAYMKYGDKIYEDGIVVRHLNSDKTDNSWDNIEIGTCHDNMMDNTSEFRMKYAINASKHTNKYSKEFVEKIRDEHNSGMSYSKIKEKYNLAKSTISHIINNDYVIF